ncbi:WS/DGAT domain-containing protein [Lentzea albida]|uniref:O-acyltransferase WSD1 C-terminal domain-containing protein n=1 Tax=Lentzea albida TaxID=65499 RepID=A0A1H9X1V8_9PSEU|nr:WS/DGAT domain-containing protein [Lentzea albida]SES40079.1 Protein of unknown function [Lentzea albida]
MDHQRLHTFVTKVRGPDQGIHLGGTPVVDLIPLPAATGNGTVAFAALSYAGMLTVTVVADPDRVPDLDVLTEALQVELDLLDTKRIPGEPHS